MKGEMVVAEDLADVASMLAARKPTIVQEWTMNDFKKEQLNLDFEERTIMRGMQAFMKARCNQCHVVAGHGTNLGPDLTEVTKKYKGDKLLRQLIEPSSEINEKYRNAQFITSSGKIVSGVVIKETDNEFHILTNLLSPTAVTRLKKKDVDEKLLSRLSPMPDGLLNVLGKEEILYLLSFRSFVSH